MKALRSFLLTGLLFLAAAHSVEASSPRGSLAVRGPQPSAPGSIPQTGSDASSLEKSLLEAAPTLNPQALHAALASWATLQGRGETSRSLLTVIDYSLPSTSKRMWVFDLASRRLLFHELVAHGRNTGENIATSFSNEEGTLMTSLGSFVTSTTYMGRNGYSMRLRGMDGSLNDQAEPRTIVVHGAWYVGEDIVRKQGRLGRSHGCPALRPAIARALIDEIKEGTVLYSWHPSIDGSRPSNESLQASNVTGSVAAAVSGQMAGNVRTR